MPEWGFEKSPKEIAKWTEETANDDRLVTEESPKGNRLINLDFEIGFLKHSLYQTDSKSLDWQALQQCAHRMATKDSDDKNNTVC